MGLHLRGRAPEAAAMVVALDRERRHGARASPPLIPGERAWQIAKAPLRRERIVAKGRVCVLVRVEFSSAGQFDGNRLETSWPQWLRSIHSRRRGVLGQTAPREAIRPSGERLGR